MGLAWSEARDLVDLFGLTTRMIRARATVFPCDSRHHLLPSHFDA